MNNDLLDVITVPTLDLDRALQIADLALALGRVNRATRHPDGLRAETDTDHTVMLMLLAVDVVSTMYDAPGLVHIDLRRVMLFALVHDLVEAYAGDVVSIDLTEEQRAEKARREAEALARIASDLPGWIPDLIEAYERQDSVEARLVHYLDKVVPKLTHVLNRGATLEQLGLTPWVSSEHNRTQGARLAAKSPDLRHISSLFDRAHVASVRAYAERMLDTPASREGGMSDVITAQTPDVGHTSQIPDHEPVHGAGLLLAMLDDETVEVTEHDVRPVVERLLALVDGLRSDLRGLRHVLQLERAELAEHVAHFDEIRALCVSAGIPVEVRRPSKSHPDDPTEDITERRATVDLVRELVQLDKSVVEQVERLEAEVARLRGKTENQQLTIERVQAAMRDARGESPQLKNLVRVLRSIVGA